MTTTGAGQRLERALQAFLGAAPRTRADGDRLLAAHPELADLLRPMLGHDDPAPADDTGGTGDGGRVLGDFRLVREIGRGGMGIVYEAWQRSLDRRVAVKVLAPSLVTSPAAIARFRREATAVARLRHPNIVAVYDCGSDGGEHYLAMQFVDGAPLHDVATGFRSPERAVALAAQLADALAHAHAAGLVHRDVKPGNVLVLADGTALLTDFGVAHDAALPSLTREGGFVGTLDYAAPEQVRGEAVDARADVWAVGVILHELLSGALPFAAASEEATLHRILTAEPPSVRGRPGVSDDLAAVVDRALAKQPQRRYPTAAALLADLRALQRGDPVTARLPTAVERLRRWTRREPWRALAAVALGIGVPSLAGTLGYLWANAGRIEASAAAEARQQREERLGEALLAFYAEDVGAALTVLAGSPPDDLEIALLRAQLHFAGKRKDLAIDALAGHDGPVVQRMRAFLDQPQTTLDAALPTPATDYEALTLARILHDGAVWRGARARPLLRRAHELAATAIRLAPAPRIQNFVTFAVTADLLDDDAAVRNAAAALAHHFPDSRGSRLARARCLARHDPAATLELLAGLEADGHVLSLTSLGDRALALEYLDRLDEAAAVHELVLQRDGERENSLRNLGNLRRKQKRHAEAIELLRRAAQLHGWSASTANSLGLALRDGGDPDGARAAFERALELRPDHVAAAMNLGNLCRQRGDHAGAEAAFRRVLATEPDNARAAANLGDAIDRQGRHEESLHWALRAASLAPQDLIPNYNVSRVAVQLGLPVLALEYAKRAHAVAGNDPNASFALASALLAQRPVTAEHAQLAVEHARAADERRKGGHLETRLLLSAALAASGDRDGARLVLAAAAADARFAEATAQQRIAARRTELDQAR